MVTIEITRKGVFDSNGERIPVGTQLQMNSEPRGWVNKYRVVSTPEAVLEVATPSRQSAPEPNADEDLEAARAIYTEHFGKAPHHRAKAESLLTAVENDGAKS